MSLDFTIPELHIGNAGTPPIQFYKQGLKIGGSGTTPTYQDIVLSGNGSLSLTNAKANSLNYLKLYGGCEQRNLPSGYTEYDGLIESDGLAYIDLNCSLTQDDEIELEFTKTSNVLSKDIFGGRSSASSNNISVILAGSGNVVEDFNNSDYTDYRLNTAVSLNTRYKVVMNKTGRYLYQGDTLVASDTTANSDTITTTGCYLFSLAGTGLGSKFQGIIHRCLIKGKRDVVPAGNGTTYGVYDKLNGVFYPNANTEGSFTVGNATVPTPDYPVDVVCNNGVVKYSPNMANMIADNLTIGYYIAASGVVSASEYNFIYNKYIPVKPNTTYTLSFSDSLYFASISEYSTADDSGFIQRNTYSSGSGPFIVTSCTLTTGATTNYIRFGCNMYKDITLTNAIVLAVNYMLTQSNNAQAYIKYGITYTDGITETVQDSLNNTATAQNLFAVGTVKDVQEVLTGTVTRNVGIKVLVGTENWFEVTGYTGIYGLAVADGVLSSNTACVCSHYLGTTASNATMENDTIKAVHASLLATNKISIYIKDTNVGSLANFKTFLATQYQNGQPIICAYPLVTATTETVTGQSLTTKKGSNTIQITQASIDNLPLEVSYKGTV